MNKKIIILVATPIILCISCQKPSETDISAYDSSSSHESSNSNEQSSESISMATDQSPSSFQSSHSDIHTSYSSTPVNSAEILSSTKQNSSAESEYSSTLLSSSESISSSRLISSSSIRNSSQRMSSSSISSSSKKTEVVRPLKGTLKASFTPVTANGEYAPKNYFAIWITKKDGTFIKSLQGRVQDHHYRPTYLYKWQSAKSSIGLGLFDAVTGASATGHFKRSIQWNLKDHFGKKVKAGVYKLHMEFTEQNEAGPHHAVKFTLDNKKFSLSEKADNFKKISIQFIPE